MYSLKNMRSAVTQTVRRQVLSTAVRAASTSIFQPTDQFVKRHIGPNKDAEVEKMLKVTGDASLEDLIKKTIPDNILYKEPMKIGEENRGEAETLRSLKEMLSKNKVYRSHIGAGYHDVVVPAVILRNILENPAWYTPYTPYQAEISQGRLEMLLNYQTMISDLTGMPVSNCSLLDESTAAAEALSMCYNKKKNAYIVSADCNPQTIDVIKTRASILDIEVRVVPFDDIDWSSTDASAVCFPYPNTTGKIHGTVADCTAKAKAAGMKVVVVTDPLSLVKLTPPGEWGADVVVGSCQRFGVPLGFGGPHAAFFATTEANKRKIPGRIIGVSRDSHGAPALRMALQTREQHIRRDKATSNICTAQALLANISAAYGIYHGPDGLKQIASKVHAAAKTFAAGMIGLDLKLDTQDFFDTVYVHCSGQAQAYVDAAAAKQINIRKVDADSVSVTFDETVEAAHITELVQIFAGVKGVSTDFDAETISQGLDFAVDAKYARTSDFMLHPVFNSHHSETDMMRYLYKLQLKDLSLASAMIPLGSCTMKLNAASEMIPVTWSEVGNMHPFAPRDQAEGYYEMLEHLEDQLSVITGFDAVTLQPNAGSQGEYSGMLSIRKYLKAKGEGHRNICLIPASAHGTNPATAVMVGMKVVVVKSAPNGNMDFEDFSAKVEKHKDNLAALMITYPSTHGVFEENIVEVIDLVHANGGQVYMDGANMNAQVGECSPGAMGADVCHLNLHKTFCIPHGGGGPGMGPIGVKKHLAPFLPTHPVIKTGGDHPDALGAVAGAPFSSASILPITWMYINMMGGAGLTRATKIAILSANYMRKRLEGHFKILFTNQNGKCAHEFIIDIRPFKASCGIVEEDIAKRLIDYSFHAPTMSWPVVGTLMIEPTESEPLAELDRFCDAMIAIREEIAEIENGTASKDDNLLKNAPHTMEEVMADTWTKPYSRERAAYPKKYLRANKHWPTTGRLDNVYGDRNVVCSCPPIEDYE